MDEKVSQVRKSYLSGELDESSVGADPIGIFSEWMEEANAAGIEEANGMALATASADGMPSVRIVLLRGFDQRGFAFYTNYDSAKGKDLLANPRAAASFWWAPLERQVRIAGRVEKMSRAESQAYFDSRPRGHQLSAWASPQSGVVAGRAELEARAELGAPTRSRSSRRRRRAGGRCRTRRSRCHRLLTLVRSPSSGSSVRR